MTTHVLRHYIERADAAINCENFNDLINFYSDDATLVIKPGLNAVGKEQIQKAFVAIAEYFNHSLVVEQGEMHVIESGDTALVLARTILNANQKTDSQFSMERNATYIFKKNRNGEWKCIIDNSYGTELLASSNNPTLHLLCGKIASGKTTLAEKLSKNIRTILISEDEWLANLYPDQIKNISDYVRCTGLFRNAVSRHIESLLKSGISVVLDFPANTPNTRKWMLNIIKQTGAAHQLHYLNCTDEICKERLRLRNIDGVHQFKTSDAEYEQITKYFVPPSPEEGFNTILY
ncbi:AAA family ATPase [Sulfurirhabdus autotrophica]|uniref:Ketosteroid isomerase-like protein n=1 Tax=Sulfurirhabdus autotrophica TaxID=1706046 RepID=A0A4V2W2B4_9PROT|nr:AAA family ATPase [Sulfurirhabdus autotrophica]TCV87419.1 ketosteroid isomerase-like protein [Sulfurirhabdus autotrophica]